VVHDKLSVQSVDGTASQMIDVTITGTNDIANITGTATGDVKEDLTLTTSGSLSVSYVDAGQAHFAIPSVLAGQYGDFTFDAAGNWTYTLRNADSNVTRRSSDLVVHDKLSVQSVDGTASQMIDVTITGTNDIANITGTATGDVKEDLT